MAYRWIVCWSENQIFGVVWRGRSAQKEREKKMNWQPKTLWALVLLIGTFLVAGGVELTFELPDNAKQCFYQEIDKNVSSTLEFQVLGFIFHIELTSTSVSFNNFDFLLQNIVETLSRILIFCWHVMLLSLIFLLLFNEFFCFIISLTYCFLQK